jgi:U4/U6.U5 tri-snRNP-associated protein 1
MRENEEEKIRKEIKEKEITEEDVKKSEALEEPIIGKGVANVLKLFRMRNMLGQKSNFVGRMKDNKTAQDFEEEDEDESLVRIVRTDKYGNIQSRKQAFRELCYAFHGQKPSQRKQENMQKRLLKAQKASNLVSGQDSFFAKALEKEQKKKKKAFMVIDSKPKSKIQL